MKGLIDSGDATSTSSETEQQWGASMLSQHIAQCQPKSLLAPATKQIKAKAAAARQAARLQELDSLPANLPEVLLTPVSNQSCDRHRSCATTNSYQYRTLS